MQLAMIKRNVGGGGGETIGFIPILCENDKEVVSNYYFSA